MPLYEYRCRRCGTEIEKIQKFSDPPLTRCEACGGKLEQVISAPAIQFQGTGWYVTDYAHKSGTPAAPSPHNGNGSASKKKEAAPASTPSKAEKPQTASKS